MISQCSLCSRPLGVLEQMLAEHDPDYQCRHCWNRIQATGAVRSPFETHRRHKPRILATRRATKVQGRRS